MTLAQIRLWLREGRELEERIERRRRAAFICDVNAAMPGPMGESDRAQEAIERLQGDE
jgi:hypothetical protein